MSSFQGPRQDPKLQKLKQHLRNLEYPRVAEMPIGSSSLSAAICEDVFSFLAAKFHRPSPQMSESFDFLKSINFAKLLPRFNETNFASVWPLYLDALLHMCAILDTEVKYIVEDDEAMGIMKFNETYIAKAYTQRPEAAKYLEGLEKHSRVIDQSHKELLQSYKTLETSFEKLLEEPKIRKAMLKQRADLKRDLATLASGLVEYPKKVEATKRHLGEESDKIAVLNTKKQACSQRLASLQRILALSGHTLPQLVSWVNERKSLESNALSINDECESTRHKLDGQRLKVEQLKDELRLVLDAAEADKFSARLASQELSAIRVFETLIEDLEGRIENVKNQVWMIKAQPPSSDDMRALKYEQSALGQKRRALETNAKVASLEMNKSEALLKELDEKLDAASTVSSTQDLKSLEVEIDKTIVQIKAAAETKQRLQHELDTLMPKYECVDGKRRCLEDFYATIESGVQSLTTASKNYAELILDFHEPEETDHSDLEIVASEELIEKWQQKLHETSSNSSIVWTT